MKPHVRTINRLAEEQDLLLSEHRKTKCEKLNRRIAFGFSGTCSLIGGRVMDGWSCGKWTAKSDSKRMKKK